MKDWKKLTEEKKQVIVQLGGGEDVRPGWINVDIRDLPQVDIVQDLEEYPWKIPSDSVDLLIASQLVEHINPAKMGFIKFMDEAWRVLKTNGQFMIATPYGGSQAYLQDPSHINPCTELTWSYFDPFDPTTNGALYLNYKPKPWKIAENSWFTNGNMEVLLEKRADDPSYHKTNFENVKGVWRDADGTRKV